MYDLYHQGSKNMNPTLHQGNNQEQIFIFWIPRKHLSLSLARAANWQDLFYQSDVMPGAGRQTQLAEQKYAMVVSSIGILHIKSVPAPRKGI